LSDAANAADAAIDLRHATTWARARTILSACAVPAIIVLDMAVTTWLASRLNIWVDEAYTLHTTSSGFMYALHQALFWELQPPLYFLLISLLRHVALSVVAARFFSIACVALALALAAAISERLWSSQHPAWLVLGLAISPFIVGIAVEIRVYALVFFWSTLLVYLFLVGYAQDRGVDARPKDVMAARVALVIAAVLAVYTQYYAGFLLPAFALVLLLMRRWQPLRAYLIGMLVVVVCALPILFVLRYQIATNTVIVASSGGPITALLHETKVLATMLLSADNLSATKRWTLVLMCGLALLVIAIVWRSNLVKWPAGVTIPAVLLVSSAIPFAIVVAAAHQELTARYSTVLFLPAMLFVYSVFSLAPPKPRTFVLIGWTLLLLATSGVALASQYQDMAKMGDWIRVSSYLERREQPGQPIVIFEPQAALPLEEYYRGPNRIVPLPRPISLTHYDLREAALNTPADVSDVFERAAPRGDAWLITTSFCRRIPINFHCELLDQYISTHYRVISDEEFYWSRVRLLERVR